MKNIKIENLYSYDFLSEVNASANGKKVLFTKTNANDEYNNYTQRLYYYDTKEEEVFPLTSKGNERSAVFTKNDEILFSTALENKDGTKFYEMSLKGGEAKEAFTIPSKTTSVKLIEGDNYLITIPKKVGNEKPSEKNRAEEGKDFYIFDEIPFWANGRGVTNKIRNTLAIYNSKTNEIKTVSEKFMNVMGANLSEDKTKLLFWGPIYTDMMPKHHVLFEYHIASGYLREVVGKDRYGFHQAFYFNGKIVFEGSDKKNNSSQNPELCWVDENNNVSHFVYLDGSMGSSVGSDMSFGGGKNLQVVGDRIYCLFTLWGDSYLSYLDTNGNLFHVNKTKGAVNCFDIVDGVAYCISLRDNKPTELYSINLETGKEKQLSNFSDEFIKNHTVVIPEYFTFTSKEGHELEGWVLKPTNYKEGEKYPGILSMHGGPKVAFGSLYNHEMQVLANAGYFVFYTNPRGSSGRGEDFSRLVGKLGETDYNDFMEFTDEVLNRYNDIDGDRIGITGGSYGGFMANWMIGNTNRFKAAVSQRSISNYFSKCLTTDIGYYHNLSQVDASPWENTEKMWHHSPLKYVNNATTPTLFIQSDEDYRCWMSEPLQMFTNLRQRGVPSKIALFHKENHELSRSGKPHNRISRLRECLEWFNKYL